ncbi:MAG TPA: hypothetical protein VMF65_15340, partial [Acidimicrobiales bacterium]|nr:hypothetical protein [Acidimicrobiales bacterium]
MPARRARGHSSTSEISSGNRGNSREKVNLHEAGYEAVQAGWGAKTGAWPRTWLQGGTMATVNLEKVTKVYPNGKPAVLDLD